MTDSLPGPLPARRHHECPASRRDFLTRAGGGLGMLALLSMLQEEAKGDEGPEAATPDPLAARPPHFRPTARSVIWCFLDGGPSHLDLFDPKPGLKKLDGQPLPGSFKRPVTAMGVTAYTPL